MKKTLEKEIRKYILNNDNLQLDTYLEYDFEATITAIFISLFSLMKKYDKNTVKINYLLDLLENLSTEIDLNELKFFIKQIIDLKNKINNLKKGKRLSIVSYSRLENLLLKINDNLSSEINNQKIKYLNYIIFESKNLSLLESYLKENNGILNYHNKEGENIFCLLLRKYAILSHSDKDELNYYFQVILIFLKSKYRNEIIKEHQKYFKILKEYNFDEKYTQRLEELFNGNYSVTLEQLEDSYHIRFEFPEIIIHECEKFIPSNQGRYDFTYQNCITMDGKKALCLDDAHYIEKSKDGTYTLYIHITDIPSLVPYDSLTNKEAKRRGETIYLRDRNILLYPDRISNNICSLLPPFTKNVITYIFKLDPHYNLLWNEFDLVKGTIKVAHKMTYEEVDDRIRKPQGEELDSILFNLTCFAEKMKNFGSKKELYREYENIINDQEHHESTKLANSIAANIVHESMILVNYRSAKLFMDKSLPYIYRKVFLPSDEFIQEIIEEIKQFDNKINTNKHFLNKLKYSYIKSVYSDKPAYHDGLKLECSSHSSSPGRRYADSACQYAMYDLIFDKNLTDAKIKTWEYRVIESVEYLNKKKEENEIFSKQYNYLSYKNLIKTKK